MPDASPRVTFSYILLRLLALVGLLLMVERWSPYHLVSSTRNENGDLQGHEYKDGNNFEAFQNSSVPRTKSKAIVAASLKGDNTSWLQEHFSDWETNVYVVNDPRAKFTVVKNKGNEAACYLTYIITHYHNLPDHVVFLHAKRYQWHNEDPMYDHVPVLKNLQLAYVTEVGYTNLRCTWEPGCRVGLRPDVKAKDGVFGIRSEYVKAFKTLYPGTEVPKEIGSPCCAQFAVSRERIRGQPVAHYEQIRQWLWDSELPAGQSGRILEYLWHIIFGQNAVDCLSAKECFCRKFGLCELECHSDGGCERRYWMPRWDQALPEEWPKKGQGRNGWPVDKWWEAH